MIERKVIIYFVGITREKALKGFYFGDLGSAEEYRDENDPDARIYDAVATIHFTDLEES